MDGRSLEWKQLLPSPVRFLVHGGSDWLRDQLTAIEPAPDAAPVLMLWEPQENHLENVDEYRAFVAIRSRGLNLAALRTRGFRDIRRYAAFPSLQDCRWFIPLDSPRVAAVAFAIYTPYKRAARIKQTAVRTAARSGLPGWYRDEIIVAQRAFSPLQDLATPNVGSRNSLHFVISTGTPGPTRKPTIAVLDDHGTHRGIIRVGESDIQRSLIANEAAMLRMLAEVRGLQGHVPSLLAHVDDGTRLITLQSVVSGKPAPANLTTSHHELLSRLQLPSRKPALSTAFMEALPDRVQSASADIQPIARAALRRSQSLLDSLEVSPTINHGDFAPWNLRVTRASIAAFDWEYGLIDGLPLLDEIHHQFQTDFLLHGATMRQVLNRLRVQRVTRHHGYTHNHLLGLQTTYALHHLVQRRELGYHRSDTLTTRLLEVLTALGAEETSA